MTTHLVDFDKYKSWSILDPRPVIIDENMCFWCGLFMHTNMAFAIAGVVFNHISVCPAQKESLHRLTEKMLDDAMDRGYEPEFTFDAYTPDRLFGYLGKMISLHIMSGNLLEDWQFTDKPFKFFIEKQSVI
jgi:hypothetical protein